MATRQSLRCCTALVLSALIALGPMRAHAFGEDLGENFASKAADSIKRAIDDAMRQVGYTVSPINSLLLDLTGTDPQKKDQAKQILIRMLGKDFLDDTAKVYQVRLWATDLAPGQSLSVAIVPTPADPYTPLASTDPDAKMKNVLGKLISVDSSDTLNDLIPFKGGTANTGSAYHASVDDIRAAIMKSYVQDRENASRQKWAPELAPECPKPAPGFANFSSMSGPFTFTNAPPTLQALQCNWKRESLAVADAVVKVLDDRVDRRTPAAVAQTQWQGQHFITVLVPVQDVAANPNTVLHMTICQDEDPTKLIPYYRLKASKETRLVLAERAGDWTYLSKRKDPKGNPMRLRALVVEIPY